MLGLAVSSLWHGILRVVRAGFSNVGEWSLVASAVCGILVFPLGIEPAPPALGGEVLFTDLPEKSQHRSLLSAFQSLPSYLPPPQNLAPPVKVPQLCPALCDPRDCSPPDFSLHGILQARILEWVAVPSPGDLPIPGIKPRYPTLQADALPSKPPGKPRNTGVGSLSLL